MSLDKKYYRRYNFKSVTMEEYEIRLLYKRESKSEIDFDSLWVTKVVYSDNEYDDEEITASREFTFQVRNISKVIEKHCKVEATLNNVNDLEAIFIMPPKSNITTSFSSKKDRILSAYNQSPIFPDEVMALLVFKIRVNVKFEKDLMERGVLNVKIHDSNKVKILQLKLSELTDDTSFDV